jgi:hypothetical protein
VSRLKDGPMIRSDRAQEQLAALFVLGAVLLLPPLLVIVNQPVRLLGVPVLYLYLFVVWAAVIGLTAAIARRIAGAGSNGSGAAPPEARTDAEHTDA